MDPTRRWVAAVTLLAVAGAGCADDDAPAGAASPSGSHVVPPLSAPARTVATGPAAFTDPMALARAVGCSDTFTDERPGGHEGVDHAECTVDGQALTLYVFDDVAARDSWITNVSGFASEADMEQHGGVVIEDTWALGSRSGLPIAEIAKRVAAAAPR